MPPTIEAKRIRLEVHLDQNSQIIDQMTGETPQFWRGNFTSIEVGFFFGEEVCSVANLSSLTIEAKLSQTSGASPVISKTITEFAALTAETWEDKTGYHAAVDLTATETNVDLGGAASADYWLTVSCVTLAGKPLTLGVSTLTIREDNAGTAGTPPTNDPVYLDAEETEALVENRALKAPVDGDYRIKEVEGEGVFLQKINKTTGKFHSFWIENDPDSGAPYMAFGPGED